MPNGYNGRILHVDLTKGSLAVEEPNEAFYRKYLGGSAMAMHYILREMPKGADHQSSEHDPYYEEGLDREADKLPKKFFKQLQGVGPTAGIALTHAEVESALDEYYKLAGWTTEGVPTRETLKQRDIEWAADYLPA